MQDNHVTEQGVPTQPSMSLENAERQRLEQEKAAQEQAACADAEKRKAAVSSVLWSALLTVIKLAAGISTNSLGILSEALHSTLGKPKTEVLATRLLDINPGLQLTAEQRYLEADDIPALLEREPVDFVVDAIDTLAPKCHLIAEAMKRRLHIVSSMGAGAKSDITQIRFADLWDTYHCGLSKAVRKRLQKMGIRRKLPVVFSTEQADPKAVLLTDDELNKKSTCGTVSYMPAVFGCYLAEYVIKRL